MGDGYSEKIHYFLKMFLNIKNTSRMACPIHLIKNLNSDSVFLVLMGYLRVRVAGATGNLI